MVIHAAIAGLGVALVPEILARAALAAGDLVLASERRLVGDQPYTLIYPPTLKSIDDGSPVTVATLQHPDVPLRCDAMIVDDAPAGWTAKDAADKFDSTATAVDWQTDFPGFVVTSHGMTDFQSGPALLYAGESPQSPWGIPVSAMHAEAVDGGRMYVVECVASKEIADQAEPLFAFVIANFSTRSDGQCCVTPPNQ
jgi:hypothetical protein